MRLTRRARNASPLPRTIPSSRSRSGCRSRSSVRSINGATRRRLLSEAMFLAVYGSPALQAAVGVDPQSAPSRRREMDPKHRELLQARIAELKSKIGDRRVERGRHPGAALCRIGSRHGGRAQPRGAAAAASGRRVGSGSRLRSSRCWCASSSSCCCSTGMLHLPPSPNYCRRTWTNAARCSQAIQEVLSASAGISGEAAKRLKEVAGLFGLDAADTSNVRPLGSKAS